MNFLKSIFVSLALISGVVGSNAANETVAWNLQAEAQVDGSGIFLDQLITSHPATPLPRVRLANAPGAGQTVSLSRAKIIELSREMVSGLTATNLSGAAKIIVSRRSRSLDSSELVQLLTTTLQKEHVQEKGELELSLTRTWNPLLVPDEPLTVKIVDLPASGISPSFVVRFELWTGKEHLGDWQLMTQCRIWREIPIAHATLTRGELLADGNVALERRDILVHRDAFLNFLEADPTLELVETIRPGMPVLNRSVRVRPTIRRGHMVDGVFQDGALVISLKVQTLEDGLLGQTVRVRNPKSKRELYGKVQNETTILISL